MRRISLLVITAISFLCLSCDNHDDADVRPKYGDRELEVTLPKSVRQSVNCFVPHYRIPWYTNNESTSIIVSGQQQAKKEIVRLRSAGVTHLINKFEYAVTVEKKGSYPYDNVSFLTFKTYEDGCTYKMLRLPEQCLFYIKSVDGKYKIINIKKEPHP